MEAAGIKTGIKSAKDGTSTGIINIGRGDLNTIP